MESSVSTETIASDLTTEDNYEPDSTETTLQSEIPRFVCLSDGQFGDPYECNKYHVCVNDSINLIDIPLYCPLGLQYDRYLEICTSDPVQCPGEPDIKCSRPGTFANLNDCNRYFKCIYNFITQDYKVSHHRCPPNMAYSEEDCGCIASSICITE